jgi:hypothetical protein
LENPIGRNYLGYLGLDERISSIKVGESVDSLANVTLLRKVLHSGVSFFVWITIHAY